MISIKPNFAVLGQGQLSNTLAQLLGCPQISRNANDSNWGWPKKRLGEFISFIVVTGSTTSVSRIVRWHTDAWSCPDIKQSRSIIVVSGEALSLDLGRYDIFGRTGEYDESISDWIHHVAVIPVSSGLNCLLARISSLTYCPVNTWKQKAEIAAVIPALHRAIRSRDGHLLLEIMPRASHQDWDAVCYSHPSFGNSHQYAGLVRKWLGGVTRTVTPDWEEGEALICPLATKNVSDLCNNT